MQYTDIEFSESDKFRVNQANVKHFIHMACKEGNIALLQQLKNSGLKMIYDYQAINSASANGHVDVLEWCKNSGLDINYDTDAMDYASIYGQIDVLNWWLESELELKFSRVAIHQDYRIDTNVIKWWMNSGLQLKKEVWTLIISKLNPSYFKILTGETDQYGYQYVYRLDICSSKSDFGDLRFTTAKDICAFYQIDSSEIYLPKCNAHFQVSQDQCQDVQMIILGPKYSSMDSGTDKKIKSRRFAHYELVDRTTPFYLIPINASNIINVPKLHHRLNIMEVPFEPEHFYVQGGVYFTFGKHIPTFYTDCCYVQEIYLPLSNVNFQILKYPRNIYWTNMFTLGAKYTLSEFNSDDKSKRYFIIVDTDNNYVSNIPNTLSKYITSDVPNKLHMVSGFDIHQYINGCCLTGGYIQQIFLPITNPNFRLVSHLSAQTYCANMMTMGQKYFIFDPQTQRKFGFRINSLAMLKMVYHYMSINDASSHGNIDILNWWLDSGLGLVYDCRAINDASLYCHLHVLDWWLKSGLRLIYGTETINHASANSRIDILDWWLGSGLELIYDCRAMDDASANGHVHVLEWWLRSGLKLVYTRIAFDCASIHNHTDVLDWWAKFELSQYPRYFKITNRGENHYGYQYRDGLNILDKPFEPNGSCVAGGLYFTTAEHIHKFYSVGCYLREIYLCNSDKFQMVPDPSRNKFRANMIILGPKYFLLDIKTYEKFGLIKPNKSALKQIVRNYGFFDFCNSECPLFDFSTFGGFGCSKSLLKYIVNIACQCGFSHFKKYAKHELNRSSMHKMVQLMCEYGIDSFLQNEIICSLDERIPNYIEIATQHNQTNILHWFVKNKFVDYEYVLLVASSCGQISVMNWLKRCNPIFEYDCKSILYASIYGHVNILKWWKKSELELRYDSDAIRLASMNEHIAVLNWWLNSGLELKYDCQPILDALLYGRIDILDWWMGSGLRLKYDTKVVNYLSRKRDFKMLNWLKNSGLDLMCDNYSIYFASCYGDIDILDWWLKSGLELKYDHRAMDTSSINGYTNVLDWWVNSGLELKYSRHKVTQTQSIYHKELHIYINLDKINDYDRLNSWLLAGSLSSTVQKNPIKCI